MSLVRLIALVGVALALTACISRENQQARLALAFEDLVFYQAPDSKGRGFEYRHKIVARWQDAVPYAFKNDERVPVEIKVLTRKLFEVLTKLTNLSFKEMATLEPDAPGLLIQFDDVDGFRINGNSPVICYVNIEPTKGGRMQTVAAHFPAKRPNYIKACLMHELLHAIGLRGHTYRLTSVMGNGPGGAILSRWDVLLIRAYYDDRIRTGMTREQAMPVATRILGELLETR